MSHEIEPTIASKCCFRQVWKIYSQPIIQPGLYGSSWIA